jgi:hypothetical protein
VAVAGVVNGKTTGGTLYEWPMVRAFLRRRTLKYAIKSTPPASATHVIMEVLLSEQ